jgi:hypothetical protein
VELVTRSRGEVLDNRQQQQQERVEKDGGEEGAHEDVDMGEALTSKLNSSHTHV